MKVKKISVLVSKKLGRNYNSWSLSYGATAEIEETESPEATIRALKGRLVDLVNEGLGAPPSIRIIGGDSHEKPPKIPRTQIK